MFEKKQALLIFTTTTNDDPYRLYLIKDPPPWLLELQGYVVGDTLYDVELERRVREVAHLVEPSTGEWAEYEIDHTDMLVGDWIGIVQCGIS